MYTYLSLQDTGPDIEAESLTVCLARSFWSYEVAVEVVSVIGKGKTTLGIVLEMWEVTTWETGKFQIEMVIEMMVVQVKTVEMVIQMEMVMQVEMVVQMEMVIQMELVIQVEIVIQDVEVKMVQVEVVSGRGELVIQVYMWKTVTVVQREFHHGQ